MRHVFLLFALALLLVACSTQTEVVNQAETSLVAEQSEDHSDPEATVAHRETEAELDTITVEETAYEPSLSISLEPFNYTLEDAGGGWNEGRVELAIANKTNSLIWFNGVRLTNILVETEEGPTYPAQLFMIQNQRSDAYAYDSKEIFISDSIPILPGFRFHIRVSGGTAKEYIVKWQSATTATPKRIVITEHPELSFDLPTEKDMGISFPFDSAPVSFESFASLEGAEVPGQLFNIQANFTGKCFSTGDYYETIFWLELSVRNTDQFNETEGEVQVPYAIYYSDGFYMNEGRVSVSFNIFGKQEGAKTDGWSFISVGPDQSVVGHLALGRHKLKDDNTATIALFWPDASYIIYDTSGCEHVER